MKEIWLWGYHNSEIAPAESNMSSPTTGDISNSLRFEDDLPIYDRTYVLYNYNYARPRPPRRHAARNAPRHTSLRLSTEPAFRFAAPWHPC